MPTADPPPSALPAEARPSAIWVDLGAGLALSLAVAGASWRLLALPASYLVAASALYALVAGLILGTAPRTLPGPGLGAANRVTLARGALAVSVLAMALMSEAPTVAAKWWIIVISTAVFMLDGVDGRIARRTGTGTPFGARFDMELDAALLMGLSVLVWRAGIAGAWVLLIGLMRYAFVAASWIWPALAAELPPSQRRKVVCVVQGVVLLVALGPIIPVALGVTGLAVGLVALAWSFAVDVRWALRAGASA